MSRQLPKGLCFRARVLNPFNHTAPPRFSWFLLLPPAAAHKQLVPSSILNIFLFRNVYLDYEAFLLYDDNNSEDSADGLNLLNVQHMLKKMHI